MHNSLTNHDSNSSQGVEKALLNSLEQTLKHTNTLFIFLCFYPPIASFPLPVTPVRWFVRESVCVYTFIHPYCACISRFLFTFSIQFKFIHSFRAISFQILPSNNQHHKWIFPPNNSSSSSVLDYSFTNSLRWSEKEFRIELCTN